MEYNKEDMLQVGFITQTHGIRGEVKVYPTTDDVNRFNELKKDLDGISQKVLTKKSIYRQ